MSDDNQPYSIQLRLRWEITQDAYVSVLVDERLVTEQADGSFRLDPEKLVAEALRISHDPRLDWRVESSHTEPHPLQTVKPDERSVLDSSAVP